MKQRATIVGLGEVLWDLFPDGPRFGGAPANFACSAAELAGERAEVYMVSAVGHDELGRRAVESLQQHGVDVRHVAAVDRPTGQVEVAVGPGGDASYTIAENVAWDAIPWSHDLLELARRADAVCFGTLGQRSEISRQTIRRFLEATPERCLRVFDVNLRAPYWSAELVAQSLPLTNVLKLNDSELAMLAKELRLRGSVSEIFEQLMDRYSLELAALTRGANGALLMSASADESDLPGQQAPVADTVGAGDAFTAAMVIGLLEGHPLGRINAWASQVAAYVCTQAGAAPTLPARLRDPAEAAR